MVLAAGDTQDSPEITALRASLTPEEKTRTDFHSVPPWNVRSPSNPALTGPLVSELPVPPDLASEIEEMKKRRRLSRIEKEWVANDMKLQYHHRGKIVYLLQTDRGKMVIAVGGSLDSPPIACLRDTLTPEENARLYLESFPDFDEEVSHLG